MKFREHPQLPKYRMGQQVFTPFGELKREIIRIHLATDPSQQHKYRVRVFDHTATPYKSPWIEENELIRINKQKTN